MKKHKVKYSKGSIGKIKIDDDFLPKPKDLVLKDVKNSIRAIKKLRKEITLGKKLSAKKIREEGRK